jgi:hypothetical protein
VTETSIVSTDYIDNPRSNNAIYNFETRLALAHRWGKETLKGGELNNKQLPGSLTRRTRPGRRAC